MISSAGKTNLNQQTGSLPDVSQSLKNWFQPMTLVLLKKEFISYRIESTETRIETKGVIQPIGEDLKIMETGERSFPLYKLHIEPDVLMNVGDRVIYLDIKYKVLSRRDYRQYGFLEYDLVEDFQ